MVENLARKPDAFSWEALEAEAIFEPIIYNVLTGLRQGLYKDKEQALIAMVLLLSQKASAMQKQLVEELQHSARPGLVGGRKNVSHNKE